MTYITHINHKKHFLITFLLYIKMPTVHYQKNKERFRKEASERYQNLPKEKKNKRQYYPKTIKIFLKIKIKG